MSTAYTPSPGVLTQELDGETILLDVNSGTYFRLNETGTLVWVGLSAGRRMEDIVEGVAAEAGVDHHRVSEDVTALLVTLREKGLVSAAG